MKKRNLRAAFRCMEQPAHEIFRPLAEQQQQAKTLPVVPTADNELSTTLAVATAIKPTETVGSLVSAMHKSHADSTERKFGVLIKGDGSPARVVEFPSTVAEMTIRNGANGVVIGAITPDDSTKEVSAHTVAPEDVSANAGALAMQVAIQAALETAAKPARSGSALIDKLSDIAQVQEHDLLLIVDQTGDGSIELVYEGAFGALTGKTGDVTQEAAAAPATAGPLLG